MFSFLLAGGVAGLVSAPHCALMCGPIAALAGRAKSGHLRYQFARLLSYVLAGTVVGWMGQTIIASVWVSPAIHVMSWALALVLVLAAIRTWRGAKPLRPRKTPQLVQLSRRPSLFVRLLRVFPKSPEFLGWCSSLLPCAALWGGLLVAASSSSPSAGATAMLGFSLTSGTGLLASGYLSALLQRNRYRRTMSALLVVGAVFLLWRPQTAPTTSITGPTCPLHSEVTP